MKFNVNDVVNLKDDPRKINYRVVSVKDDLMRLRKIHLKHGYMAMNWYSVNDVKLNIFETMKAQKGKDFHSLDYMKAKKNEKEQD